MKRPYDTEFSQKLCVTVPNVNKNFLYSFFWHDFFLSFDNLLLSFFSKIVQYFILHSFDDYIPLFMSTNDFIFVKLSVWV